jgi:hypothetical protein
MNCQVCQTPDLAWSETVNQRGKHYLYNVNTGATHECKPVQKPQPVQRYDYMNGIAFNRQPNEIARDITRNALAAGLDPFKVRLEVRETVIVLH